MFRYLIRRLLLIIPTLFGITIVCFFITRMLPGGPVEEAIQKMLSGSKGMMSRSVESKEVERLKKIYGFDKPVVAQYFYWVSRVIAGDFGDSFRTHRPVLSEIAERFPISLTFGLTGFFLAYLICIPLGIAKALKHNTLFDSISSIIVYIGYSIPGFALGILLLVLFGGGSFWNIFPLGGIVSDNFEYLPFYKKVLDYIHHMILPVLCYTIGGFALLTTLMKNSLMEELGKDYIKTALAKGLSYKKVVVHHALQNAFIPILTGLGSFFGVFFAGSILIEKVFNIPGMGLLAYNAIIQRNYPVVLGLIVIQSLLNLVGRLVSDFSLALADPRISFD
ncbi:MAG: ABC transporter permease subunit [Spirochaetales bacterium]|nr:ABC transporter permease subunit [Spirochaetales bacterium]